MPSLSLSLSLKPLIFDRHCCFSSRHPQLSLRIQTSFLEQQLRLPFLEHRLYVILLQRAPLISTARHGLHMRHGGISRCCYDC